MRYVTFVVVLLRGLVLATLFLVGLAAILYVVDRLLD